MIADTAPIPSPALQQFIAGLPKVELHVHHVGSASPRIVAELAERHPGLVPADPEKLAEFFTFRDFAHFVELYLATVSLIKTPQDIRLLTYEVATDMAAQNIRYAELTCTPYTSVLNGIPIQGYLEAIEDARIAAERDHRIRLQWIFDVPGEIGPNAAEETATIAIDHGPAALVAFGLGGPEIGTSRPKFKPAFDRARAAGLHSVPHAGETTGPQTIWDAIEFLGAERIGHGTSASQDPKLLEYLAVHQIPVEVCPTSNIATRAVPSYQQHPLRAMVDAGVQVSINSDDPPMFGTSLNREYGIAAALLDLDAVGVAALAHNAVQASFLADPDKRALAGEIDAYLIAQGTAATVVSRDGPGPDVAGPAGGPPAR
jgi:aminodeoxyfutalosine deaminase